MSVHQAETRAGPAPQDTTAKPSPSRVAAPSGGGRTAVSALLGLQRSAGNRGVAGLLAQRRAGLLAPPPAPRTPAAPPAVPTVQRAGPLVVTAVTPGATELGVGRRMTARATVTGTGSAGLTWTLSGAPAGVTVHPRGRTAEIRSAAPVAGAPVGGASFTVSCAVGTGAPVVSAPVQLIEVTGATFTPVPAFGGPFVTAIGSGVAPPNTADPNLNGISGNTATVVPVTAPAGRAVSVAARGRPGATASGLTVRPGAGTGNQRLRITDPATGTFLDTVLVINSVPTRVSGFGAQISGMPGQYGGWNTVLFAASDPSGPDGRVIAELITVVRDDFGFGAPTGGAGAPSLAFSALANSWTDLNGTPTTIDVNQFEGPGAPGLPRLILYRQEFRWMSWTGTYAGSSMPTGQHRRTLLRSGAGHVFRTEQIFPAGSAPVMNDAYAGPLLIVLNGIAVTPTPPATGSLAADGVSTGNLTVVSSVATRQVDWTVLSGAGRAAITAGAAANPVGSPATVTAGTTPGVVRVRATDTVFANRRGEGTFRVVAVTLGRMSAAPAPVPTGTLTAAVSVTARPGGRVVDFAVDGAAAGAGVTVGAVTVTGNTHSVDVTRPAGFAGLVTITATDRVLPAKSSRVRLRFN